MARRSNNRYFIYLGEGEEQFKVSAGAFTEALKRGWIEPDELSRRVGRLAAGVVARVRGGILWLRDRTRDYWLYTSWISIDEMAPARGEHWQQTIEDEYGNLRFEKLTWVKTGMIGWNGTRPEAAG